MSPKRWPSCTLQPGSQCHGVVRFTQDGESVKVVADLEGLTPGQERKCKWVKWVTSQLLIPLKNSSLSFCLAAPAF